MSKVSTQLPEFMQALKDDVDEAVKEELSKEIKDIKELLNKGATLNVKTSTSSGKVEGLKHKQLKDLITLCSNNIPVLMVGMAGTGKSHSAEQVAEALSLKFYAMSVGAQTSKSDIMGFIHANGEYVKSHFRTAYEKGGVFLMDEIDAGNSNVLIQINSALSNEYCAFPDKMVKRHKNFVFVASANTFGTGANRMYVGRNQLDSATLDRFAVINWEIDESLEANMVTGLSKGQDWVKAVRSARKLAEKEKMRVLITPRAVLYGAQLLEAGLSFSKVLDATILKSIPEDKQSKFKSFATKAYKE